ncbi:MAG: nitroreductase family protein [Alphaproteobacteria bacterium]|nr:nitroreductase family protein [Alphaproteobacteria bacterium]
MKKILALLLVMTCFSYQAEASNIKLPWPDKLNPTTLMHALNFRQSTKNFDTKEVDDKTLSSLLWAAWGLNRSTGERTIPTAMNQKELSLYVFKKEGVYLYDAPGLSLNQIQDKDLREIFLTQEYMKNAPIVLVWTSTNKDYGPMHAGSSYQNVGLFAVAHKMGAVVRGYFDKAKVREALKLKPNEEVLISMAVGYPIFTDKDDKDVPDGGLKPDVAPTPDGVPTPGGVLKPEGVPTSEGVSKPEGVPTPNGGLNPDVAPTPNGVPTPEGLLNPDVALTPNGVSTPELKAPELKSNEPVQAPVPSQEVGALPDAPKSQSREASKDLNNSVQAPVSSQVEGAPLPDAPKTQSSEASKDLKVAS